MEKVIDVNTFFAKDRKSWRKWLQKNSASEKSVYLIIYNKKSNIPSINYNDAVEEALCFGWIDSKGVKRDDLSSYLYFARRKPQSNWSRSNRERVEKLIKQGLMTEAGFFHIDQAKKSGTWDALSDAENLVIPADLQKLFNKNKTAFKNFNAFSPSSKKMILSWISGAKRAETREKRILKTVELASKNIKSK